MPQESYKVKRATVQDIVVRVPGSKSITNRALLLAALCEGRSLLQGVLFSDDSRHFIQALKDLGFPVEVDEENEVVAVTGFGGCVPAADKTGGICAAIDVGSAGTAARFLTAFLGLSEGNYYLTSSEQMKKRPMRELLESLESLGAEISFEGEKYHFPFKIRGAGVCQAGSREVTVDVDKSSQFLSALLISAVLFEEDFVIHVAGSHGMAYVDMTVSMMEQFGVRVEREGKSNFRIPGNAHYAARDYQIEPDVSAAAYFYAMCPVVGTTSKIKHVHWNCLQGDIEFLHVLEQMGCQSEETADGIVLYPPADGKMHGGTFDLSAFSDQALTLAAISCFADSAVKITGIEHIRYQECDRLNAILENLRRMGITCAGEECGIAIEPGKPHGCEIATFEDHRVAMSFAIPGLVTDGIVIENPMCCRKTFENYFEILEDYICK